MNSKGYTSKQKLYFALLVNLLIPLAGMSTDIYLPSLPAMSAYFNVDKALVQLTVTSFVIAMGLSQFLAGPIADAYGRKKLLLLAISTQLLALFAIVFSRSVDWMIFFRFVQGLGAAFMIVPARAILNDVFESHELKKQFNYSTISFALGPIIAPFLGGYLQQYFGWQASFLFILIYAILLFLAVALTYRETQNNARPFSMQHMWKNYHIILSNRYFLLSALLAGMVWGYGAFFNVTGPFLIQIAMHHSAITYGHIALWMGLAWFLGNTSSRILFNYDIETKTEIALWLTVATSIIMFIIAQLGFFNILTLAIPTFMIILLSGFIFPIYIGECMVLFQNLTGSANACLFGLIWLIFGGFTSIATLLRGYSLIPLTLTYLVLSIFILLFYYGLVKRRDSKLF